MQKQPKKEIRRRIAPAVPLTLNLADDSGDKIVRTLRLSFDFNAHAIIEELTGFSMLRGQIWQYMTSAKVLGIVLWAASLACQPEYEGEEGLIAIRSYIGPDNSDDVIVAIFDAFILSIAEEKRGPFLDLREKVVKGAEGGEDPTKGPETAAPKN